MNATKCKKLRRLYPHGDGNHRSYYRGKNGGVVADHERSAYQLAKRLASQPVRSPVRQPERPRNSLSELSGRAMARGEAEAAERQRIG